MFPLGLPNDSHILLVSAVGIQYKGVPGSVRPSRQGGSVCLSVSLRLVLPFIPVVSPTTPFFAEEELALLRPPPHGKSA